MNTRIGRVWIAVVCLVIAAPTMATFCEYTASEAYAACRNDAWDDFHEGRGKCVNNQDRMDRKECRRENSRDRDDAFEECEEQLEARLEVCDMQVPDIYDPDFDPEEFVDPDAKGAVENPYVSLVAGHTSVIHVDDEIVITHVTDEVKVVAGVPCRVVVDVEFEAVDPDDEDEDEGDKGAAPTVEYEPLEITDDWYALHQSGDLWYCGELSRNYEDGELADLDGSFEAGKDGAKPGILIRANPVPGEVYRQEFALAEAEDVAEVLSLAASPPDAEDEDGDEKGGGFDCDGQCLQTRDFSPLEPGNDEHKFYLAGVGFVLAIGFEDGEEDGREVLACTGDSLEVLADPACGIENLEDLLDELCDLDPDTFCDEE